MSISDTVVCVADLPREGWYRGSKGAYEAWHIPILQQSDIHSEILPVYTRFNKL